MKQERHNEFPEIPSFFTRKEMLVFCMISAFGGFLFGIMLFDGIARRMLQ